MKTHFKNPANPFAMLLIALAIAFTFLACEEKGKGAETGSPQTYTGKTVKIGSQTWMAENLNIKTGNSWCYDNDEANCQKYGRLYDWETAVKACPSGWHLPSSGEWLYDDDGLIKAAGEEVAGKKLKSKTGWNSYEGKSGNGTDEFGFSALSGGRRNLDGTFADVGDDGVWWSSSEQTSDGNDAVFFVSIAKTTDIAMWDMAGSYNFGFSVRCVKD
jgi:uncharacterized protein (TIGR02145 family)